jgi:fermentation-respiration switch protein FrsA (DUF1100 family)
MLDRFRSDLAIRDVRVPVLMVHGEDDGVIPTNSAGRLFGLANEPKTFVSVPGGSHLVLELADVFPCVCEWIDAKATVACFPVGGFAILHQGTLRRRTSRAALAAIGNSKKAIAAGGKHPETWNAINKRAATAVEVQD